MRGIYKLKSLLMDTNIIIRFLTNDDEIQSPIAYQLFEKAVNGEVELVLNPMIVAECTWILQMKRYGYTKTEIAEKFKQLILSPGMKTLEKSITLKALSDYHECKVDFFDAYLCAASFENHIITWNKKDFKKLDCTFYTPEQIID